MYAIPKPIAEHPKEVAAREKLAAGPLTTDAWYNTTRCVNSSGWRSTPTPTCPPPTATSATSTK